MVYHFSRRSFVKAASGLLIGATGASTLVTHTLPIAHAATTTSNPAWMGQLEDGVPLSVLSIPGTHDSCALHGGPLAVCQNTSIAEQLAAGIRFLDIRCRHISNVFAIHHDAIYQQLMFGSGIRDVCINFLKANPSECIVMSIKEEYTATGNTRTFTDTFLTYVTNLESFWYLNSTVPTMKDARGKIILLRRFSLTFETSNPTKVGIDASYWPDNQTFNHTNADGVLFTIQDQYQIPTILPPSINNKWAQIQPLLDQARTNSFSSLRWYINFTSGSSAGAYPKAIADRIHSRLSDYLVPTIASLYDDHSPYYPYMDTVGTLPMDFPSNDLVNQIIATNSKT